MDTSEQPNLKILVISPWKSRWSLGGGAGVSDDHHFIEKLSRRGFELHFLTPRGAESTGPPLAGATVHTYPNFFDATNGWPTALKRIAWPLLFGTIVTVRALFLGRILRPDFVLGHSHYGALPAYMCRKLLRVPSGVKLFGVMDLVHTEWPRLKYYFKNLEQIIAMKIPQDVWIVLDDGTQGRDAALRHGVPKEKVRFLPNGIDVEWIAETYDRDGIREELAIHRDAQVVLFLARLVASKRPDIVIRSIPEVKRLVKRPVVFLFAGDGPERQGCERLARRLGVADDVLFVGVIPHRRVPEIMAAADLFVSTSRHSNMAIPTCEALVCGLPVVGFDVGDTGEVIRSGETGLLVPDGDTEALAGAIGELLADGPRRRDMARRTRTFAAEHFTGWQERTDMEIEIIRATVGDRGSREP